MGFSGFSPSEVVPLTQARANHRLARERIHFLLIDDAKRGLADIAAGRTLEADGAIAQLQQSRTASADASRPGKASRKRG